MTTQDPSSSTTSAVSAPSRALQGILCIEIGMLFFVVQDAMMKSLLLSYPIWMLLFIRSVVSIVVLVPLILFLGGPHKLRTPFTHIHFMRGALFATGFSLFYTAFPFMGLAEVTTIFFSAPLITALMAAFWLKETIGPHRIGALAVGFVGVVIAVNPTGDGFSLIALLPLACAVTYSASQILVRTIGEQESSLTVGLHTLGWSGVLILPMGWLVNQLVSATLDYPHLHLTYPEAGLSQWPLLVLLGATGMCGYIFLSRAYQVANASLVAPFDYTYLPLATALGYFVFSEVPGINTLTGMALIVSGGLYLGFRELRATQHTDDAPVVAETVFAPASPHPTQIPEDENLS